MTYRVNTVMANLGRSPINIGSSMLNSQCCHLYGAQAWDLTQKAVEEIRVTWNKCARRMLSLPYTTHRALLPCLVGRDCAIDQAGQRFIKMIQGMLKSKNSVVNFVTNMFVNNANSLISGNLHFLERRFDVKGSKLLTMCHKALHCERCDRNEENSRKANMIIELTDSLLSGGLSGFHEAEIKDIIVDICTT
jgi:hypothetical protein